VPLGKVLDKLGEEGILTLLTETGTRLNTALLAGGLVDRIHLFVSPQIMGSDAVPGLSRHGTPSAWPRSRSSATATIWGCARCSTCTHSSPALR
jgi:riboflavin biosynthesis pyrimidine reductase